MEFAVRLAEEPSIDPLALRAETGCSDIGQLALTLIGAVHGHPVGALQFRRSHFRSAAAPAPLIFPYRSRSFARYQ